jgi:hypothetical protein
LHNTHFCPIATESENDNPLNSHQSGFEHRRSKMVNNYKKSIFAGATQNHYKLIAHIKIKATLVPWQYCIGITS